LIETLRPQAGMSVVRVLEKLGVTVEYPRGQTCCGQPAFNAGAWDDARRMAKYTLDVLGKSDAPIVVPSGSCADMLVHHYPEILASDPIYGAIAEQIAARTYEFTQYLVDVLGITDVGASDAERMTYHPSCHLLRGLKNTRAPLELLSNVQAVELVELPGAEECCGFGGLFAIKMADISAAMLDRKLDAIESTNAQVVVGCDVSCLLHIGGGLHRRGSPVETRHLAEILDRGG
jgi:L-lactate dehydrogenase complex protein LldE